AAAMSLEAALKQTTPGITDDARAALSRLQRPLTAYEVFRPSAEQQVPPESPIRPLQRADIGVTLIETLLVAGLVGALAAIAVPGYLAALEKARVTRAIVDIRTVQREIQAHWLTSGCYPATLADVGFGDTRDPWGSPYSYGVLDGAPGGGHGKGGADPGECAACSGAC